MKCRLGASISSLFAAGAGGGRNCKALSFNPKFLSFHYEGQSNRNLLLGFESLRRSLYSSAQEEDEFSELGPSVAQGGRKRPKLMTEKPDFFLQNKKVQAGRSSHTETKANVRNILQKLVSPTSDLCPKPEKIDSPRLRSNSEFSPDLPPKSEKIEIPKLRSNSEYSPDLPSKSEKNEIPKLRRNGEFSPDLTPKSDKVEIPKLSSDNESASEPEKNDSDYGHLNNVSSITIENVPTTIDLVQLMQAVSKYGMISSASMQTLPDGRRCCDVEFENLSSSKKAVTVGSISIKKKKMRILPSRLHGQETCAIRITGISKESTDPAIHALCKEIGSLEGLIKTGQDVDAIFSLKNDPDIQGILAKLNSTTLNNCQWSASLLPRNFTSNAKLKHDDAKTKLGLEIQKCLTDMKKQHNLRRIHIEDLQALHDLITHLEEDEHAVSS